MLSAFLPGVFLYLTLKNEIYAVLPKVTSNYSKQYYTLHFVKSNRAETMTLNDETSMILEPYSVDWYQFTAPSAGSYKFSFTNHSTEMNCEIYLDDLDGLIYDKDAYWTSSYSKTMELDEGQVVWINYGTSADSDEEGCTLKVYMQASETKYIYIYDDSYHYQGDYYVSVAKEQPTQDSVSSPKTVRLSDTSYQEFSKDWDFGQSESTATNVYNENTDTFWLEYEYYADPMMGQQDFYTYDFTFENAQNVNIALYKLGK